MQFLQRLIEIILKEHRRLKRLYRVIFVLACVVVFITTYALTLPAITIDKETAARMGGMQTGTSQYRGGMGKASDETATGDGSEQGGSPADSEADSEGLSSADDAEPGEAADDSGFNEESGGGSGEDAAGEDPDGGAAGSGAADGAEAETSAGPLRAQGTMRRTAQAMTGNRRQLTGPGKVLRQPGRPPRMQRPQQRPSTRPLRTQSSSRRRPS